YINAADICLATFNSDVGDGSVMKVYEYLSCGKPTVGSSISSLQFLKEIDAGDLVPLRDPKALAQAVWRLYLDKTQRDLQSERLRNYIVKYHSWEAVSKKLLNLMRSTLGEHLINKGVKNEN
ncbi:MAG: glycosyltransferase, partial [Deltaproteobacteria bacterium]|nr:glycosyltransferase [Deltaproteobacteria bacterium]